MPGPRANYTKLRSGCNHLGRDQPRRLVSIRDADTYTKDLVICSNSNSAFPPELLKSFEFAKNGQLVSEIWYDPDTGQIHAHGSVHDEMEDFGEECDDVANCLYARLVTTNWWYGTLSQTLLAAAMISMGKNALLFFCSHMVANHGEAAYPMNIYSRGFVVSVIVLSLSVNVRSAMKRANVEFHQKCDTDRSGDLVQEKLVSSWDIHMPYWALILFHMLEVNVIIRDIVKYLHPHKDKQPFCAFKADGHRAFMLGWQSEHAYRSKFRTQSIDDLIGVVMVELIILLCQVYAAIEDHTWAYAIYSLPSIGVMCIKLNEAYHLALHREHSWAHLMHVYECGSESDKAAAEKQRAKEFPAYPWEAKEVHERRWLFVKLFSAIFLVLCGALIAYQCTLHTEWLATRVKTLGKL